MDRFTDPRLFLYRSRWFSLDDLLYLPRWSLRHDPTEAELDNLSKLVVRLDFLRDCIGVPLRVTSGIRPRVPMERLERELRPRVDAQTWKEIEKKNGDYNAFIGGAGSSAHITGEAADAVPVGMSVDEALARIIPHLEFLGLRAENNGESRGRPWLHVDARPVPPGGARVFNP